MVRDGNGGVTLKMRSFAPPLEQSRAAHLIY